ncbi:hypothetical protein [Pseudomonas oryzihabitans]|uniref:hypothetical protein n=1 Tax=Pseudomonas oryzihabitans TaxID=47885 RepID=UPI0028613762|nr:hypothetical protein [Pseudomonas psychrotolerans]MDR6679602.1 hypothetical protein [Pseudomonas psychrotolerans]
MVEPQDALRTDTLRLSEKLLARPLTHAERLVLEAFLKDKPDNFVATLLGDLQRVTGQTSSLIETERQRTKALIQAAHPQAAGRQEAVKHALDAADLHRRQAMTALEGTQADRRLTEIIQQEVKRSVEEHMQSLIQQVEAALAQLNSNQDER